MTDRLPVTPRNKHGTPVDPVPFLVASLTGFTVVFSYGPIYLMELGVALRPALAICAGAVAAATAVSYHRYVWTSRPELRREVPVASRLKRLFYGVLVGIAALVLLSLPLLVR